MLTTGNANRHGMAPDLQKQVFALNEIQRPLVGHHVPVRSRRRTLSPERRRHARGAGWRGF